MGLHAEEWQCDYCHSVQGYSEDLKCFACEGPLKMKTILDNRCAHGILKTEQCRFCAYSPETTFDKVVRCGDCGQRLKAEGADCDRCDQLCANCNQSFRLHYLIGNAGRSVCPTSVFYPKTK
jgi:hypothetical protein